MANEGELPDLDLKMPSLELDLPEPTLNLDLPDLKIDAPADPASGAQKAAPQAGKARAGAKQDGKQKQGTKQKKAAPKARMPGMSAGTMLPALLNVLSIVLLIIIIAIMYVFNVPVNMVPDLSLTTYVQSLWLVIACFFIMSMLQDMKTALILTGLDIAMLLTIFPTLWLLLDTPMNPMYFFVLGLIVLQALVAMPLSIMSARKQAAKKSAPAGAGATPSASTGPRTMS